MYLFFDTETTGLPRNWKAPVTDLNNWPRLVQLAYLYYDADGKKIMGGDCIIKPEGFTIPTDASRVHGITTERALEEGVAAVHRGAADRILDEVGVHIDVTVVQEEPEAVLAFQHVEHGLTEVRFT